MTSRYRLAVAIASLVCLTAGCGPEKGDADPSDTGVSESEKPDGSEHRGSDGGGMDADEPTDAESLPPGEALYRTTEPSNNSFACATCHALEEPTADGLTRPGHPIGNATRRPNYKNGKVDEMRVAVNSCLTEWMNADPWEAGDEDWEALRDWLDEQATVEEADPLSFEIVEPPSDLTGGDAEKGRTIFNNTCKVCHGEDGSGTTRALPVGGRGLEADKVARRVRTSGSTDSSVYDDLTGGKMPFWAKDRLSDQQLRHIVAFLGQEDEGGMDAGGMDAGIDTGGGGGIDAVTGSCDKTHRKVGWTAELEEKFHNVGGTAEIIDDCTVAIRNFTYDGRGIVVEIYGAPTHGEYAKGYSMTDNLVRSRAYKGETLVMTLPDGKTLDDLDGVSVWCVDVGADFGSGEFTQ
jgi:mono/diheme cytochrome c family protein